MDRGIKDKTPSFEQFSKDVLFEVMHTGGHQAIKDELEDHYLCLLDDYLESGNSPEVSHEKAITSLGSPKTIGKSFNNIWFPEMRYNLQLILCNILTIIVVLFMFLSESSYFLKFSSSMLLIGLMIMPLSQGTLIKYLSAYVKKQPLSFVRVYAKPKNNAHSLSYVERLTNRVFIVGASAYGALYVSLPIMGYFEEGYFDKKIMVLTMFSLLYAYQFFLTMKIQKTPIVIIEKRGIWVQGRTLPYIGWTKVKSLEFNQNYKKEFICTIITTKNKKVPFNCSPLDRVALQNVFDSRMGLIKA